jgi:diguanylate cyclase (GGDEF)-like protein
MITPTPALTINPLDPAFLSSIKAKLEHDSLTGMLSRRTVQALLKSMDSWCSPSEQHSVFIIDLDHFKPCNDTLGHEQGDRVLIELASIMAQELPSKNYLGRWGGDEFLVILPNTGLSAAVSAAEHLRMVIEQHKFASCPMALTITIGVATTPLNTSWSSDHLLCLADCRLCAGKKHILPSRNRVWAGDLLPCHYERWHADYPSTGPFHVEGHRSVGKIAPVPINNPLSPTFFASNKSQRECDSLTGILAPPALIAILDEMSNRCSPDDDVEHSVLYIDIDLFKDYHDTFGHDPSDQALIEIATIIAQESPSPHYIGRIGGDEFLVILPNTGLAAATTAAEHLRMTIAQRPLASCPEPLTVTLTVTIGVATTPLNRSWSSDDLIALADARTFVGKNCLTPCRNRVWAGDLPSDWGRQWKANWPIDWRRKWGTNWPSADPIVSAYSQQEPTSSSHVEDSHLAIDSAVLRFQSVNKKDCSVTLDHGKNTVFLGEVDHSMFLSKLNRLFTIGVGDVAGTIEDMDVCWIASFKDRHYMMYARMDGDEYCFYFKDNDSNIIATIRLNKHCVARTLTDISALDKVIKGESHIQRPPATLLSWIKAKV